MNAALKKQSTQEEINNMLTRIDKARIELGRQTMEAQFLAISGSRIRRALEEVEEFTNKVNEGHVNQITSRMGSFLQAKEELLLLDPIINCLDDKERLIKRIQALRKFLEDDINDIFFNPMNSTNPFNNLNNIEKKKAVVNILNIFRKEINNQ